MEHLEPQDHRVIGELEDRLGPRDRQGRLGTQDPEDKQAHQARLEILVFRALLGLLVQMVK